VLLHLLSFEFLSVFLGHLLGSSFGLRLGLLGSPHAQTFPTDPHMGLAHLLFQHLLLDWMLVWCSPALALQKCSRQSLERVRLVVLRRSGRRRCEHVCVPLFDIVV